MRLGLGINLNTALFCLLIILGVFGLINHDGFIIYIKMEGVTYNADILF